MKDEDGVKLGKWMVCVTMDDIYVLGWMGGEPDECYPVRLFVNKWGSCGFLKKHGVMGEYRGFIDRGYRGGFIYRKVERITYENSWAVDLE